MIVPMKKITLLAMAADEDAVLSGLRSLGVMQLEKFGAVSGTSSALSDQLQSTRRVIGVLEKIQPSPAAELSAADGETVCRSAEENIEKLNHLDGELESCRQKLKAVSMWGDFDRSLLDDLAAQGIEVFLCSGSRAVYEKIQKDPEVSLCQLIAFENSKYYFAVVGSKAEELPVIKLQPDDDPRKLSARIAELEAEKAKLLSALETAADKQRHRFAATDPVQDPAPYGRGI